MGYVVTWVIFDGMSTYYVIEDGSQGFTLSLGQISRLASITAIVEDEAVAGRGINFRVFRSQQTPHFLATSKSTTPFTLSLFPWIQVGAYDITAWMNGYPKDVSTFSNFVITP